MTVSVALQQTVQAARDGGFNRAAAAEHDRDVHSHLGLPVN